MREVTIRPVLNGWVIRVGCSEVVKESKVEMLSELSRYIDNPNMVEREYQKNAINKMAPAEEGRGGVPTPPQPLATAWAVMDPPERVGRIGGSEDIKTSPYPLPQTRPNSIT